MGKGTQNDLEIHADIEGFNAARSYVETLLESSSVSQSGVRETMLVFEAVFNTMLERGVEQSTTVTVSTKKGLAGVSLQIGYEGERFSLPEENDSTSSGSTVLRAYAEKVSYGYSAGYNTILVSVRKDPKGNIILCGSGILIGIVVYLVLAMFLDVDEQHALLNEYIFPFEQIYGNAMLMVGAPVTFFSLLKNASNAFIVSKRNSDARRLRMISLITSAFAVLLALALSYSLMSVLIGWQGYDAEFAGSYGERSFSDIVTSMVPTSIFEPFEALSPIPLIIVALLVTYALVSAGKDYEVLGRAIDVCYGLFSRMLSAVMFLLPVACCLAALDVMLEGGHEALLRTLLLIMLMVVSSVFLFASYAARLKVRGVKVIPFAKKLLPLVRENFAIGSVINAVPYNIRYCVRNYGLDRERVSRTLPFLAQINLDGNCFLLMFVAVFYIFATGTEVPPVSIVVISALVLFLSFGAPNQPGSILIGSLIIVTYLKSYDVVCMAIYLEFFLGGLQNMINVISDIVTVSEEEARLAR
ncbi:dicarboxylate/amino acid:cation symporter [Denitrobacterium detoxificans]|jgi:Na+/H+-dicarboxylate symporter|uniref:dicarboxylate/amino acid:cation symporter n=1 Tax=Denitrobacterium detoxificans TaxID=79604 RepID=UPI0026EF18AC|nr:cation:dicarboxylase symporter family transporter [Denitrobacterium detoxificans]MBE6466384.1 dicarboxylate/amino acid:cation symporter [Denitrobacterium detoxificans]